MAPGPGRRLLGRFIAIPPLTLYSESQRTRDHRAREWAGQTAQPLIGRPVTHLVAGLLAVQRCWAASPAPPRALAQPAGALACPLSGGSTDVQFLRSRAAARGSPTRRAALAFRAAAAPQGALHTARDAASAATGRAAAFLARLVARLHLQTPLGWLRQTASRVLSTAELVARRLGTSGAVAAAAAVVTSPTGRSALRPFVAATASATRRGTRTAARSLDRTLRLCGGPGHHAADYLRSQTAHLQARLGELLASLTTRTAWLRDVDAPHARLVAGLARSYLLHLMLRATTRNAVMRLLVEGVLVPLVVNSRLGQWLRSVGTPPPADGSPQRPAGPAASDQAPAGPAAPQAGPAAPEPTSRPGGPTAADPEVSELPTLPAEDNELPAAPEPLNRAQRRAQLEGSARRGAPPPRRRRGPKSPQTPEAASTRHGGRLWIALRLAGGTARAARRLYGRPTLSGLGNEAIPRHSSGSRKAWQVSPTAQRRVASRGVV